MKPVLNGRIGNKPHFAIVEPQVLDHARPFQIHVRCSGQGHAVLQQIDLVFDRIEFDLHDLL